MTNPLEDVPVLSQSEFFAEMVKFSLSGEETDEHEWAVTLASILGVVSLHHGEMSKDEIVASLQRMAIKVPESVLDESSDQLERFLSENS